MPQTNKTVRKDAVSFPVKSLCLCMEGKSFWRISLWKGHKFLFLPQNFAKFLSNRGRDTKIKEINSLPKAFRADQTPPLSKVLGNGWFEGTDFIFLTQQRWWKRISSLIYSFNIKPPHFRDGIWDTIRELSVQVLHLRSLQAGLSPYIKLQDNNCGQMEDAWESEAAQRHSKPCPSSSLGPSKTPNPFTSATKLLLSPAGPCTIMQNCSPN